MAKKRSQIIAEFKTFLLRGNVIDLAVGVIIGGAFNKIITSLVNDVVMPVFSLFLGAGQFGDMFIALNGRAYSSLADATDASAPLIKYGSFISTVLDFLLMGVVIFVMVKFINFLQKKIIRDKPAEEVAPAPAPATKVCPFCMSEINIGASVCPMCTSKLESPAEN